MKNIIVIAVIAGVFLTAMGGGFYVMWSKISAMEQNSRAETQDENSAQSGTNEAPKPIFSLETIIANLADQGGRRYLRATMDLEIGKLEFEQKLMERMPQVKDAAIQILSTRRFEDINSIAGKDALKNELMVALNTIVKGEVVTNLYFTEFVVQ